MRKRGLIQLFCLSLFFLFTSESFSVTEAGRVLTVKRDVYLLRGEQRSNAKPQLPLLLKDSVETAKKSRTKLFFTDDSILNLGELSRVKVEEYLYSNEKKRSKSIYRLIVGSLKVVVGRSDLEIHTPTAVAAARGTKFIIWTEGIERTAKTCTMVLEGEVIFRNIKGKINGTVSVREGQKSCVPIGMPPVEAIAIDPKELKRFTEHTVALSNIPEDMSVLPERLPVQTPEWRFTTEVVQPPVSQESIDAFEPDNTPVNIIIVFPE